MIAALALHLSATSARAEPVEDRQVLAAIRALAYDRRLAERSGQVIDVAVVHDGGPSKGEAQRIVAALGQLGAITIQNLPVRVVMVDGPTFLGGTVPADVTLLPSGLGASLDAVIDHARSGGGLVAGFDLAYLPRGAVLAVVTNEDRLRLVVDLQGSRLAGASFSSQLLQLAELYP